MAQELLRSQGNRWVSCSNIKAIQMYPPNISYLTIVMRVPTMSQAEISSIHFLFPLFWSCHCLLESLLRFEACRREWEWAIHPHCGWLSHQGNLHTSAMKPNSKGLKMERLGETNKNLYFFLTNDWSFVHKQSFPYRFDKTCFWHLGWLHFGKIPLDLNRSFTWINKDCR